MVIELQRDMMKMQKAIAEIKKELKRKERKVLCLNRIHYFFQIHFFFLQGNQVGRSEEATTGSTGSTIDGNA